MCSLDPWEDRSSGLMVPFLRPSVHRSNGLRSEERWEGGMWEEVSLGEGREGEREREGERRK